MPTAPEDIAPLLASGNFDWPASQERQNRNQFVRGHSAIFLAHAVREDSAQLRCNRSQLNKFVVIGWIVTRDIRQNPSYPGPYRCLASAFAHLGRTAEAREAAVRVLEIDPAFTISAWIARSQLSKNAKLMIEGFRKAGLPE